MLGRFVAQGRQRGGRGKAFRRAYGMLEKLEVLQSLEPFEDLELGGTPGEKDPRDGVLGIGRLPNEHGAYRDQILNRER